MKIRAVDATRPGSCHDAFVLNLSSVSTYYSEAYFYGSRNSLLLADSACALQPYVLVPYKSAAFGTMQHKFNITHSSARNVVERTIGNLKSRYRSLQVCLFYSPSEVVKIVNVCCALTNICKHYNVPVANEDELVPISNEEVEDTDQLQDNITGVKIRDNIARTLM
ncbi:Putative nuclease HARBI1 [Eumeta japonica]|uniref:Nuclease HARBI1 n=1 Tax=Eumeta variegata TaxID=151549 RepID=A0A4C1SCQ3_EUMVA|nr:Putative nuclease HARBI1 [Eumeta japonica]